MIYWPKYQKKFVFYVFLVQRLVQSRKFNAPHESCLIEGGWSWHPLKTHCCVRKWNKFFEALNIDPVLYHICSCDQAAQWMVQSVRLSVRLSVTPFWLCSHHHIIMKSSGVVTNDKSDVHAKGQGQRSKVKVPEVNTQLNRFRTVTPVWIHYDDEMMHIAWWYLREVPYCFSRSSVKFQGHTALKSFEFDPDCMFPDCNSSLNSPMATKWYTKLEVS